MICRLCREWRHKTGTKCRANELNAHEFHFSECGVIRYSDVHCTCNDNSPEWTG